MTDVTIVIATYNRPEMLEVELDSILASAAVVGARGVTTRIIVVDDASELSASEAAWRITSKREVDYIRRQENGGVAATLVTGFEQVDSPYYAFWGDDDYFLLNWFDLHLAKMAEGCDVVAGSYRMADVDLRPTREVILPVATFHDLKQGKVTCNDGSLVRRDSLGDIKFRPERERAMMMTFWQAMAAKGAIFDVVTEPTWLYRRHATNMSNQRSDHDNELRRQAMAEYA